MYVCMYVCVCAFCMYGCACGCCFEYSKTASTITLNMRVHMLAHIHTYTREKRICVCTERENNVYYVCTERERERIMFIMCVQRERERIMFIMCVQRERE
jgi:hypothetical protein